MNAQHTQGRLELDEGYRRIAKADDGRDIFLVHEHGNAEANARRLVACWNACEGLPTAWIEGGAADILEHAKSLNAQRDELLAALQEAKANAGNPEAVYRITSAAIAKATA